MLSRRTLLQAGAMLAATIPLGARSALAATSTPDWAALAASIDGELIRPGDAGYDNARTLALEQFDAVYPQAVAYCANPHDVAEVIAFARRYGLPAVPRSGGHSYAGYSTTPGIVIDVSRISSVRLAGGLARIGAGAQLVDVQNTLLASGLVVPAGWCPTVAMGGLALGGGFGLEGRRWGLTIDRMRSATVVLADGRVVECDAGHRPDLFWALRGGGGGNFGVATEYALEPVPATTMTNYTLSWPWSAAVAVLDAWQRWAPATPDEMAPVASFGVLSGGPPFVSVYGAWLGPAGDVPALLQPLLDAVGVDPDWTSVREASFRDGLMEWFGCQDMTVAQCHRVGSTPFGQLTRVPFALARGNFMDRPASRDDLAAILARFDGPLPAGHVRSLDMLGWGGAVNRVPVHDTAFLHRASTAYAGYSVAILDDAEDNASGRAVCRNWVDGSWSVLQPAASPHSYQNFIDSALVDWRSSYYGAHYPVLVDVKHRYDPDRFFRFPQAIG